MKPQTSIEDIEWLLARSAAFDAGYAFVTSYEALEKNASADHILASIALWEEARMNGVFSEDQKKLMEDVNNEFHLERLDDDTLLLSRIHPYRLDHKNEQHQPGEPHKSAMEFSNPGKPQLLHFIISASKCGVINPWLEIDDSKTTTIPVKLNAGEHLKYEGQFAGIYSAEWKLLKSISLDKDALMVPAGAHSLDAGCNFIGLEGEMKIEIRLTGKTEKIIAR